MTAQSDCTKSAQSTPKAAQRAHTLCVPYVVGTQCAEQLGIGQSEPDETLVVKQPTAQSLWDAPPDDELVRNIKDLAEWPMPRKKRGAPFGNMNRYGPGLTPKPKTGKTTLPEFTVWASMKLRCSNSKIPAHIERYQKRGITVCDRWLNSFENFYADMGPRPFGRMYEWQLDRIDNDKGYSPDNCRWARAKENAFNKSTTKPMTFHGMTASKTQWAIALNCSPDQIAKTIAKLERTGAPIPRPAYVYEK